MTLSEPIEATVAPASTASVDCSRKTLLSILESILSQAEADERELSYHSECRSETARRQSGSYYTPIDVADFFWAQFFYGLNISSPKQAERFLRDHTFIEPSAGSGVLIFSLLKKLVALGVSPSTFGDLDLRIIDINRTSLNYIQGKIAAFNSYFGVELLTPRYQCQDFRTFDASCLRRPSIFFGNPPFVSNPRGSTWKNIYADFISTCLKANDKCAALHFILPLSIAFSRDYSDLRRDFRGGEFSILASHFDNIPDTLFKSGKPQSANSNKANSQRCTILTAVAEGGTQVRSSGLIRWTASQRQDVLGALPTYFDVSDYSLDDQFIRPQSRRIADYLQSGPFPLRLRNLVSSTGYRELHVGSVARNFIPIREQQGSGVNTFAFGCEEDFYKFLGIITSDAFLEYWRSVGDGFHLTKNNITSFPISENLYEAVTNALPAIKHLWRARDVYRKTKLNSGTVVTSFDLNGAMPSFLNALTCGTTELNRRRRREA